MVLVRRGALQSFFIVSSAVMASKHNHRDHIDQRKHELALIKTARTWMILIPRMLMIRWR